MTKLTAPDVTFSLQAVVQHFPQERHEAIDMTPELVAFAVKARARVEALYCMAKDAERLCLAVSLGEGLGRASGGPDVTIKADNAALNLAYISVLAAGRNSDFSLGWVGRREWGAIVDSLFRTVFTVEKPAACVGQFLQLTDGGGCQYQVLGQEAEACIRERERSSPSCLSS